MLYVFHVDCGRMMKFDMNMALSRVEHLKHTIEMLHGFPANYQVLLVSGGEILLPATLVCSYSAGTDTNPIFMFTTEDAVDKTNKNPWPSIEPVILEVDLKDQVERSLLLPATYATVVQRAQLAQQIFDLAREEEAICEKLVHEQHLQQQGWAAVIANMEDLIREFHLRYEDFRACLGMHMNRREVLCEVLRTFDEDIENLARIPVLPKLTDENCDILQGFDEILNNDDVFGDETKETSIRIPSPKSSLLSSSTSPSQQVPTLDAKTTSNDDELAIALKGASKSSSLQQSRSSQLSLLQWISSKENHPTLRTMSEECQRGLGLFDERKVEVLQSEVCNILRVAQQDEIKEIKGLGDRLCGLEKLMFDLKKIVQEQRELATAFQQNQNRASNLGDPTILPDLCASHRSQLLVMLQSQRTIRDMRRRISKAKEELADNLYRRLKYIVHIENTMSELDNSLLFYHRCLKRVDSHLSVITQIHEAPKMYVKAVLEVVRRRLFSTAFSSWASNLACDLINIYRDEISRRQEFNLLFQGHFLCSLFPGMEDLPPGYASRPPYQFDGCLPKLTKSDIDTLSSYLPEVVANISSFDMRPVIEFFNSRSGVKNTQEKSSLTGKLQSIGGAQILARPIDIYSHLKDGFESETDTEEFEKVGQSPNERKLSAVTTALATIATSTSQLQAEMMTTSTTTEPVQTHTVETLTEENLGSTTLEVERLKGLLKITSQLSFESLRLLKTHLASIKSDVETGKIQLEADIGQLSETWFRFNSDYEREIADELAKLRENYAHGFDEFRTKLSEKDNEIESLKTSRNEIETNYATISAELTQKCNDLTAKLQNAETEKDRALLECRDQIVHEHKTEIESLRCRFKLMTSMERSPSDTSLEKIERLDFIDVATHEMKMQQMREEMEIEKDQAIQLAIDQERLKSEENSNANNATLIETYRKIIDEKEKQWDEMRERDLITATENRLLKMEIQTLAMDEETNRYFLHDQIKFLKQDRSRMEQELNVEKARRIEMETELVSTTRESEISVSGSGGGGNRSKMTSSQSLVKHGVQTESCNRGDTVFVVWNSKHGQYVIVQEASTLYFLHGDSHSSLNLRTPNTNTSEFPEPYYCMGRVVDKEYCHARKDENRYRVTKGTKFYRVKVQPIVKTESCRRHRRERNESTSSASSLAVSRSTSTQHLIDSSAQTDTSASTIILSSGRDMTDSIDCRDRTISVTEEDDEQLSFVSDRYRCVSLSEEEERGLDVSVASTATGNQDYDTATTTTTIMNINTITASTTTSTNNPTPISTESSSEKDQDDSDEYRSLEAKDETYYSTGIV